MIAIHKFEYFFAQFLKSQFVNKKYLFILSPLYASLLTQLFTALLLIVKYWQVSLMLFYQELGLMYGM